MQAIDVVAPTRPRTAARWSSAAVHSWYTTGRSVRNLFRQPAYIVAMLSQPLVRLIFVDAVFHQVVRLNGFPMNQYVTYLAPGVIAMSALFSGGINGTGMLRDITHGVLDKLLTLPVSRAALFSGRLGLQAVIAVMQTTIIIVTATILGARFSNGVLGIAILYLLSVLLGGALAMLSNAAALVLRNEQSLGAIMNFALFPATFLSTAFMLATVVFGWIGAAARYNPLNWTATAARAAVSSTPDWMSVVTYGSYLIVFMILCATFSWYAMSSYRKNILPGTGCGREKEKRKGGR